ncbi:MAG: dTMP kinase, partial [Cognatishimia sp.]
AKGRQTAEERFEDFGQDLQTKMRAGFLALSEEFADRYRVLDGNRSMGDVALDVHKTVRAYLA